MLDALAAMAVSILLAILLWIMLNRLDTLESKVRRIENDFWFDEDADDYDDIGFIKTGSRF